MPPRMLGLLAGWMLILRGSLLGETPPAATPPPVSATPPATKPAMGESLVTKSGKQLALVYFEENFKGKPVRLEVPCELNNDKRLKEAGIKNDSIMSLKIPDGIEVTLYTASGYKGPSKTFTGKVASLGELAGQASSLKAEIKK